METKIVIITQYYRVKNEDSSYCLERQKEVDFCLIKNCENPFIDQIHLLLDEEVDLSFLLEKHIQKITKKNIKKRLTYDYAFEYYNKYLSNTICILQNADIYLEQSIEIIKHVNFDLKVVLALNCYETNNHLMNGLCNNEYSEHQNNNLIPYQASVWSQNTWVWKTKDVMVIPESNFELGIVGCDNYIATLFKENGYHVINPSYLVCVNHHDHLNIKKKVKQLKKKDYLFLQNIQDIPDQYTETIQHDYFDHTNGSKTQHTSFKKHIKELVLEEERITASSYSSKIFKPIFSKFSNENYWEPHEDDYKPYIEYNFSQTEKLVMIDIQGKKVNRNDLIFGYVTEFKIMYFWDHVWYEGGTHEGIKEDRGNYVKRIYLSEKISCQKIRIYPNQYKNICALQIRFYSILCPNNQLLQTISNPFVTKTKIDYKYNVFMYIYDLLIKKNIKLANVDLFLETNKENILNFSDNSSKKINYQYYKYFDLPTIKRIFNLLQLNFYDSINLYLPPYKLILCKYEYIKYGIHRYGWQNVIDNFLCSNYSECDDFHYMNPNFEWVKYAYFFHLKDYKTSVEHYMRNKTKDHEYYYMDAIIFDDWLEKTYNWKGTNCKDKSKYYHISYLSFIHDPCVDDLTDKVIFTQSITNKLKRNKNYLTENEYFLKEKKNCKLIFTLTEDLRQKTEKINVFDNTLLKSIKHPMNTIKLQFNIINYIKNTNKGVYFIGWWLRKYDTFLKIKSLNHTKKILLKNTEGKYIEEYIYFELRKILNDNENSDEKLNNDEIKTLKTKYNTNILNYLENDEYDKIFTDNIVFIELYATSANNIVLECIMTNTPLLINYSDAVAEYLGKDYPFYFHSLEEAEQKINDVNIVIHTHIYLSKLDKSIFSYETFNKNVCSAICEYFIKNK